MDFLGESNSCDSVELQNIQLMATPGASPHFTITDTAVLNGALRMDDTYNDTQPPYVDIVEQPQHRGFRFRYECEGPSHGGLQGERTERSHKTYPSIRVNNYQGPAQIEVSLVTDENPPRIHAHKLVGKNCEDGVCRMNISSTASVISFPNLCVLHVTRKTAIEVLLHRILEDIKLKKQLNGANQSSEQLISAEEHVKAKKQAVEQARSMALNVVRLQFRVFLPNAEDQYLTMLTPVVSKPIYDSKSPAASTLKICRIDKYGGCCTGNEEVFLLCEKVQKEDILVRFVEYDKHGNVKWEASGNFSPLDVHRQFAIVFRTPAYVNTDIDKAVTVHIMLQRKSDNEVSEPKTFTYYPQNRDKDFIARKKRKALPLDNTFGNSYSGPGAGAVFPGNGIGEGFRPLGIDRFGMVGGGGEQSSSNYSVIMPDGNVVDQLNVLPATVEQAVKEEFAHSPQSVTVEDWSEVPDNFLETILTDDLEIDAAPSLRHPSQMVSTTGHAARILNPKPDRNSSSMVMKLSKDDKPKSSSAHDEQNKDSMSDERRKDSVSNESKKDSQLDKSRKDSDDDKQKRDSDDEKQRNDSDNNKQTDMEHVKERDDSALPEGEEGKEPNRTGLSLHEGKACTTVEKDRSKVCSASKTEIVRTKTELKELDQQKETLVRKSGATDETADKQNPKTHSISDRGGEKHSGTIPSPTRMGHIAPSEGMRTDEGFSEMSEVSSVKGDQERMKTQVPPEKKSGREDTEDQAVKPMKAATAVVRRIVQRIAAKTVLALRDYSETGDPRYLLLVQRHLTAIKNENGDLPLHLAVINSQTTALQHLLAVMTSLSNARQIINTHNYIRQTALHLAAIMQQPLAIELLLHAGADPSLADRNGNTPAHLAVLNNSVEGLRSLVKYLRPGVTAANPFPELDYLNYDGYSPVHLAAQQGNVDMLRLLVHGQADMDLGDGKSGRTALHHAVELDDLPVAGFLLMEANADVNARCFDGNTPLHVACCRGLIGMVALLMTAGALTDVENEEVPPEDCGEGGEREERGSRHCRRGLQPRDYVVGKDRLQILRMLMGDTANEDDYQSSLDPDLREDPDLRDDHNLTTDPDLREGQDYRDDPDPTADLDHEEDCQRSVVNDFEQKMSDSETYKATYDSGVVDSLTTQSASSFPVKDKLSQEGHAALSKLLDPESPGKDVLELAGRLGYDTLVPALEVMACSGSSPTLYLLDYNETYGTLSKLRECLQAMERDDALQILDAHM